jgi:hypothetical protein
MTRTEAYPNQRVTQVPSSQISDGGSAPGVWVADTAIPCLGCSRPTVIRVNKVPGHWGCISRMAPVTEQQPERDAFPDEVSMFRLLQDSITASRKRPVLRISTDDRVLEPWALITEPMRGEHRYRIDAPAGRTVKSLDRNGSYPAAMANVPVAAGPLRRTGAIAIDYTTGRAGIYRIPVFPWDKGPHPLGEISEQDSETWWISTPHLKLCMRLAARNRIPAPRIIDSWTANSVTNLFKEFSAHVSELRELARPDEDAYGEIKRKSSIAIRALWPKGSRSPFWRPDWSVSVRAEASVRHWVRADQAMQAGAELVRLGNVDEAAFLIPAKARGNWLPEPYHEGTGFGYVKTKGTMLAAEWNRPRRGTR